MTDKANTIDTSISSPVLDRSNEDKERLDLEKMTPQEVFEECLRWRMMSPYISKVILSLKDFQRFARNADELQEKVTTIVNNYEAALKVKQEELNILAEMMDGDLTAKEPSKEKRKLH